MWREVPENEDLGFVAYTAHANSVGSASIHWKALPEASRKQWRAAANAVAEVVATKMVRDVLRPISTPATEAALDNAQAVLDALPEPEKITVNGVHCLVCNTDIYSTHRHECRSCKCPCDSQVFVDGGLDYLRRGWGPKAHFRDIASGKETKGSEAP